MTTIKTTASAPHHKEGLVIPVVDVLAEKMIARGWATEAEATKGNNVEKQETTTQKTKKK